MKKSKKTNHVVSRSVDGEEILLNLTSGRYFGLNESGSFIWQQLQLGLSEEETIEKLCEEFEVDELTAKKDVAALSKELRRHKLHAV